MSNLNPILARLINEGITSIAKRQEKIIAAICQDIADECTHAVNRGKALSGHTVRKWQSQGYIPRPEFVEIVARKCVTQGRMDKLWLRAFLNQTRHYDAPRITAELFAFDELLNKTDKPPRYTSLPDLLAGFVNQDNDIDFVCYADNGVLYTHAHNRLERRLMEFNINHTVTEQEAAYRQLAQSLFEMVSRLNEQFAQLEQGVLTRTLFDFTKGGLFYHHLSHHRFLFGVTIDQMAVDDGAAEKSVKALLYLIQRFESSRR